LWKRWLRGLGLSFYAYFLLGIAWSPLVAVHYLDQNQSIPEWLRIILGIASGVITIVVCPLAFDWLTRKFGITMAGSDTAPPPEPLTGPRVTATPAGDGKKKCSACGALSSAYAVRCHECKAVFVDQGT
jgi:hypothetical protein